VAVLAMWTAAINVSLWDLSLL